EPARRRARVVRVAASTPNRGFEFETGGLRLYKPLCPLLVGGERMRAKVGLLCAVMVLMAPAVARAADTPHTVTWDKYSLLLDGKRVYVWSGEFHPFRLPNPDLWRDILQKMKANGYNAVSIYVDWSYHSPKPGVYDFSGVRDMDRFLDIANEVGI